MNEAGQKHQFKNLNLHESMELQAGGPMTFWVTRVPGGWIYHYIRLDERAMTATFVPDPTQPNFIEKEENELGYDV